MARNKEKHNNYMREYMRKRYNERRQKAIEKLGGKCTNCGTADNLHIDHIDPKSKSFAISGAWGVREDLFWEEIAKCQLLCNSCHMQKTIQQRGFKPAVGTHGTLSAHRYCKCDICKKAKSDWGKEYRKRKAASLTTQQGM